MTDEFRAPRPDVEDRVDDELGQVDCVFVIDSTGSMGPYINEARRRARDEATRIAQSGALSLRIGLVAYRDHVPQDTVLIAEVVPLSPTESGEFEAGLGRLQPTGGGDAAEAVFDGLDTALTSMQWRPRSDRFVFLLGDAPPHGYGGSDGFPTGCPCGKTSATLSEAFRQQRVRIDAVSIAGLAETTRAFTEVAEATGGRCAVATQPREAVTFYAESMRDTSRGITNSRALRRAMRANPAATTADLSTLTGMTVNDVTGTATYLSGRGFARSDSSSASGFSLIETATTDTTDEGEA